MARNPKSVGADLQVGVTLIWGTMAKRETCQSRFLMKIHG
ncbi:hypothetical protein CGRA01v4_08205 [Colletotrichum graminicola]|nr:hypothetical protein CGRA01v4_08205 [Colletotrichum graminicola]